MKIMKHQEPSPLQKAKDEFVTQWGAIGNAWGINRIMAQIHALLMISPTALTTDQIMEELKISRGHAHANLRELCGWGLIRSVIRKGERKEYFEAEKNVWKIFCIVARERRRREIEPAIELLRNCEEATKDLKGEEAKTFHKQIISLQEFVVMANSLTDKIARSDQSQMIPFLLKQLK